MENSPLCAAVLERFPEWSERIEQLLQHNADFDEMCGDYEELTGWKAPAAGGPTSRSLTREQRVVDREARLVISRELGHEREQITTVYLGR